MVKSPKKTKAATLSIIVAAYNVEDFIQRCIESIAATIDSDVLEIIVVNDGSTDNTPAIIRELSEQIPQLTMITQTNRGLGAARNAGIQASQGDYIWFVDGDDFLATGSVQSVVHLLERDEPDILVVDFTCADEDGNPIEWISSPFRQDKGRTMSGRSFFSVYFATTYAWLYIMRREILITNKLSFLPRANMQDAELMPKVLNSSGTVVISGVNGYIYVKRRGSFVNSDSPNIREAYFHSVLEVYDSLIAFFDTCADADMRSGLSKKLNLITLIILRAYIYDSISQKERSRRLLQLISRGHFPFKPLHDCGYLDGFLRVMTNYSPIVFPSSYQFVRSLGIVRAMRSHGKTCTA